MAGVLAAEKHTMDRDSVAQINEGVLYLYSAASKRELGEYLCVLMHELFQNIELSIISSVDCAEELTVEFSTCLGRGEAHDAVSGGARSRGACAALRERGP